MKRSAILAIGAFAIVLLVGGSAAYAQGVFKIPFKFKAAGQNFPAGEYSIAPKGEDQLALRKEPGGEEILIPVKERLEQPETPVDEAQVVFDMVGNFEPSYTEYITEYVLAKLWLPGEKGYLVQLTKGAHKEKVIKAQKAAE